MRDFQTQREKSLDLVIARPAGAPGTTKTFKGLVEKWDIPLTAAQKQSLSRLPDIAIGQPGPAVLVALEAKATMTAHQKALPRLYDELNSSHLTVHGASAQALSIAYVQVNAAEIYLSPDQNKHNFDEKPPVLSEHQQPKSVQIVLRKVSELPRRTGTHGNGFDGIGITVLDFENRGGPIKIVTRPPALQPGDPYYYGDMIIRMANEYDSRFHAI
jgi:hypothetical protein